MSSSKNNNVIDALNKIGEAKELLDMDALTQDEFDSLKSKYLKQIYKVGENQQTYSPSEHKTHQTPSSADIKTHQTDSAEDVIGDILSNVIGDENYTNTRSSAQQKAIEKAASQAMNTVSREVTKGIMRGIFGQMK